LRVVIACSSRALSPIKPSRVASHRFVLRAVTALYCSMFAHLSERIPAERRGGRCIRKQLWIPARFSAAPIENALIDDEIAANAKPALVKM